MNLKTCGEAKKERSREMAERGLMKPCYLYDLTNTLYVLRTYQLTGAKGCFTFVITMGAVGKVFTVQTRGVSPTMFVCERRA